MHTTDIVVAVVAYSIIVAAVMALIVAIVLGRYCNRNKRSHLCMNNATRSPHELEEGIPAPVEAEVVMSLSPADLV